MFYAILLICASLWAIYFACSLKRRIFVLEIDTERHVLCNKNRKVEELINSMIINFNSKPENILCFIGPSIHKCCFEIQEDIVDQFEKNSKELISRKDNKVYADIVECNRINLIREGVREENIVNSDLCTKCNSDFLFSYRSKGCQSLNHGVMIATLCIK